MCSYINLNVSNNAEIREIYKFTRGNIVFHSVAAVTYNKSEWGRKSTNVTKLKHELIVTAVLASNPSHKGCVWPSVWINIEVNSD